MFLYLWVPLFLCVFKFYFYLVIYLRLAYLYYHLWVTLTISCFLILYICVLEWLFIVSLSFMTNPTTAFLFAFTNNQPPLLVYTLPSGDASSHGAHPHFTTTRGVTYIFPHFATSVSFSTTPYTAKTASQNLITAIQKLTKKNTFHHLDNPIVHTVPF